jgi:hypothetical protein
MYNGGRKARGQAQMLTQKDTFKPLTSSRKMRVLLTVLFIIGVAIDGAQGFASRQSSIAAQAARCSNVVACNMMARPQDMEEQLKKLEEEGVSPMTTPPSSEDKELNTAQKAFWAVNDVWSYAMITVGIAFSLGLLLNLCGYGYQFSYERGLEIETIGKLREMNQFRSLENARPPSSLPK